MTTSKTDSGAVTDYLLSTSVVRYCTFPKIHNSHTAPVGDGRVETEDHMEYEAGKLVGCTH